MGAKMNKLLALIFTMSCGQGLAEEATAPCKTPCGQDMGEMSPSACRDFGQLEAKFLLTLGQFTKWDANGVCKSFALTTTSTKPKAWDSKIGKVQGLTSCWNGGFTVEYVEGRKGTLVHEWFHVVEGCDGHINWIGKGYCFIIWWTTGDFTC